ncbi:hypothetical protein WJX77_000105 [Trebouxia sp. C0004]
MKHRIAMRKLGRSSSHRKSMLRTMVSQLLRYERIETTVAKAKELRRLADKVVTIAKENNLHARRKAAEIVRGDDVMHKLFTEIAERYKHRQGGYTRVLQTGQRPNDAAHMAVIEYIDRPGEMRPARPPKVNPLLPQAAQAAVRSAEQPPR